MIIHKFGGTSIGSAERIAHVADILIAQTGPKAAVVSAMSGVTDQLIAGARGCGRRAGWRLPGDQGAPAGAPSGSR